MSYMKLHTWSFGIALGVVWGIGMLLTGLISMATGWGAGFITSMQTVYLGFQASVLGSVIGGLWAFLDGFIGGAVIAAIYNLVLSSFNKKTKT